MEKRDRCIAAPLHGFTLVDLLVAIFIVAVLFGLLLPAVQSARESARRIACQSNLREVGIALANYVDARRRFPDAASQPVTNNPSGLPSLPEALAGYCGDRALFRCASDYCDEETAARIMANAGLQSPPLTYFDVEGLSYEYPMLLAGRTIPQVLGSPMFEGSSARCFAAYDFSSFHGPAGESGSQCFLFLDGHVESVVFTTGG